MVNGRRITEVADLRIVDSVSAQQRHGLCINDEIILIFEDGIRTPIQEPLAGIPKQFPNLPPLCIGLFGLKVGNYGMNGRSRYPLRTIKTQKLRIISNARLPGKPGYDDYSPVDQWRVRAQL
jgi:hypothetical protein